MFACPHCRQMVVVPPEAAGRGFTCQRCRQLFMVPPLAVPVVQAEPAAENPFGPAKPEKPKAGLVGLIDSLGIGGLIVAVVGLCAVGFAILFIVVLAAAPPAKPAAKVSAPRRAKATPQVQAERKAVIEIYVRAGLIDKITTPGSIPRVMVNPDVWRKVKFEDKQNLAAVIGRYCYETGDREKSSWGEVVSFRDVTTDKEVAHYSPASGLEVK